MTHPIDPLTPGHQTARNLWNDAARGDVMSFLFVWERFMTAHEKALDYAYENGMHGSSRYDEGYSDGEEYGRDMGYDVGYRKAWEEAEEKIRAITGERITP